jgi:RNA polymerase sigma-70 factor (ECF subfamily)
VTAQPSDAELVTAAQAGDRGALDTLLRRHYDRIHAVCSQIAGSTRDGDDAAQEAMISIVKGLGRFDGRSTFSTWSYRIATNAALDELRRRGRRPALRAATDDDAPSEPPDGSAHHAIESVGDRMVLRAALAELPDEFRVAVVLRDVGDLDYAEIATVLGVPVGTVKSRIARGRAILIGRLGNRSGTPQRPTADHSDPGTDRP